MKVLFVDNDNSVATSGGKVCGAFLSEESLDPVVWPDELLLNRPRFPMPTWRQRR